MEAMRTLLLLTATVLAPTVPARAQSFVTTFDGGVNTGSWTYGVPPTYPPTGGNPDWHLRAQVDTFAPQVRATAAPFVGDYRARGVSRLGFDLRVTSTQFNYEREASLILSSGDCQVYLVGTELVPQPDEGWRAIDYDLDTQSTTIPAGWAPTSGSSCQDPDTAWNTVITNVTEVRVFYGHPEFFFIFDIWDTGFDNGRIFESIGTTTCSPAVPNSTGQPGVMTVEGSDEVADDILVLTARQLPPASNIGYFLMGTGTNTFTPPGSAGPICIAPGIQRFLPPVQNTTELDGGFRRSIGTSGPISDAITRGSTWGFQAWHRDGAGLSNLTDAVRVTFQ